MEEFENEEDAIAWAEENRYFSETIGMTEALLSETWKGRLQKQYADFEEFENYSTMYDLHTRLGYSSPEEAWEDNPMVTGGTDPKEYRKVKTKKKVSEREEGPEVIATVYVGLGREPEGMEYEDFVDEVKREYMITLFIYKYPGDKTATFAIDPSNDREVDISSMSEVEEQVRLFWQDYDVSWVEVDEATNLEGGPTD